MAGLTVNSARALVALVLLGPAVALAGSVTDSAVVVAQYEPAVTEVSGTVVEAMSSIGARDPGTPETYWFIHLDKPVSLLPKGGDSADGMALHQYDILLYPGKGMTVADLRPLVGQHVSVRGQVSSSMPHPTPVQLAIFVEKAGVAAAKP